MVAELQRTPGEWRLFSCMVAAPISVVTRIRRRGHRELRLEHGRIYARKGVTAIKDDDSPITDVWLRYKPNPRKEEHARPD